MPEVIGRELRLPTRPNTRLRDAHHGSIVDQDVNAAPRRQKSLSKTTNAAEVSQIELLDLDPGDTGERLASVLRAPRRNHHRSTRSRQSARRCQTDAGVAAGDHHQLAMQVNPAENIPNRAVSTKPTTYRLLRSRHAIIVMRRSHPGQERSEPTAEVAMLGVGLMVASVFAVHAALCSSTCYLVRVSAAHSMITKV